jgi:Protein of unknown function DUF262/Protein of unknown function (DUF1524)
LIDSAKSHKVSELFDPTNKLTYKIPNYQREYSWTQAQWQALVDDLLAEDAENGHFLGTIITINATKEVVAGSIAEVIDGQQRLTTLTLLLLAMYIKLTPLKEDEALDDDQSADYVLLRRMLQVSNPSKPRLELQTQNNNNDDLLWVLADSGIKYDHVPVPQVKNIGNRRIGKALRFFENVIEEMISNGAESAARTILDFFYRVQQSAVVVIQVASYADAFVLFESLNYRGVPLSPIDLIKNSFLAISQKKSESGVDESYELWSGWISLLGDDYKDQERFFRHFYNAFRLRENLTVSGIAIATRTKLIQIYEALFKNDEAKLVGLLNQAVPAYQRIISPEAKVVLKDKTVDQALLDLSRIDGTPCHALLLYIFVNQKELAVTDEDLIRIIELLIAFFVRRNLTNIPSTNLLDRLFTGMVESLQTGERGDVVMRIQESLRRVSVDDEVFAKALRGQIYEISRTVARYILVKLAIPNPTMEARDLWARVVVGKNGEKENYLWTVEHIFPQAEKTPSKWVELVGGAEEARFILDNELHTLGNLTLSAYNSSLGTKSFQEKRDRVDDKGQPIGYKNGLKINIQIAKLDVWNKSIIEARTEDLANEALEQFPL